MLIYNKMQMYTFFPNCSGKVDNRPTKTGIKGNINSAIIQFITCYLLDTC